jgi:hypothetical protein
MINQVYTSYFAGNFPATVCIAVSDLSAKADTDVAGVAFSKITQTNTNKKVIRKALKSYGQVSALIKLYFLWQIKIKRGVV